MDVGSRNPALAIVDQLVFMATDLDEPDQDFVEARTLALLDELVLAMYQVNPPGDFTEQQIDAVDANEVRRVISARYSRWRSYNTVMTITSDVGDTELAIGSAIDDLTDIVVELMLVQRAEASVPGGHALWLLLDSYYNFWRGPLRSLQLFAHYLEIEPEASY